MNIDNNLPEPIAEEPRGWRIIDVADVVYGLALGLAFAAVLLLIVVVVLTVLDDAAVLRIIAGGGAA